MKTKAFLNWSGGKDSALAFYKTSKNKTFDISTLFTTINKDAMRISMHGTRVELLKKQAESLCMPLMIFELPAKVSMEEYDSLMLGQMNEFKSMGIRTAIYGDILLQDLKEYREKQLARVNINAHFPLWGVPTKDIIAEFIDLGFKTIVTCVDANLLDESFAGRIIDRGFLKDLPKNVDICGENGEFHTFVFDGPTFKNPIGFTVGEKVYKEYTHSDNNGDKKISGFWYCDLVPDNN